MSDSSASVIAGAIVTLDVKPTTSQRTTVTDASGNFQFTSVNPGNYRITVTAGGFAVWTSEDVTVGSEGNPAKLSAVLQVAPVAEQVSVSLPPHELAAEQLKTEEKQRLLGVFPHYFVTYEPNPAPLTAKQKFQLGWKSFVDPVPIFTSGLSAGIQQARNSFPDYGQGAEGYAKRFGANYADRVDDILIGHVLMQSVFQQDPRYFYKGTGSTRSRFLYAIATAFVSKGDNGHWQPAYSAVLGGLASYELSTLYRPGTSRPWLRLSHTVLLDFAGNAAGNLFEEFLLRKVTTHVPKTAGSLSRPILRAGTPVSLISAVDLNPNGVGQSQEIGFVLASDLQAGQAIVAKAGASASGRVSYSKVHSTSGGDATQIGLKEVRLTVGKASVPLRSTQVRGDGAALQYHRLENSGRIALVLYVDEDTAVPQPE